MDAAHAEYLASCIEDVFDASYRAEEEFRAAAKDLIDEYRETVGDAFEKQEEGFRPAEEVAKQVAQKARDIGIETSNMAKAIEGIMKDAGKIHEMDVKELMREIRELDTRHIETMEDLKQIHKEAEESLDEAYEGKQAARRGRQIMSG